MPADDHPTHRHGHDPDDLMAFTLALHREDAAVAELRADLDEPAQPNLGLATTMFPAAEVRRLTAHSEAVEASAWELREVNEGLTAEVGRQARLLALADEMATAIEDNVLDRESNAAANRYREARG